MQFKDIYGQADIKQKLIESVRLGRTGHAQLFFGPEGNSALAMAIAYLQFISCESPLENDSCGHCPSCNLMSKNSFPDLHYVYPVATSKEVKEKPKSADYRKEWDLFLKKSPHFNLMDWISFIGAENKQALINVSESTDLLHKMSMKAFNGRNKFCILWLAEKLNNQAANKLLKLIEEPEKNTVFILISQNPESLLQTISSRCQKLFIPAHQDIDLVHYLNSNHPQLSETEVQIATSFSEGSIISARQFANQEGSFLEYAHDFREWMRAAFKWKTEIMSQWVDEHAAFKRDNLKDFLLFCQYSIQDAFKLNYGIHARSEGTFKEVQFDLEKFAPFITLDNASAINHEIDLGIRDIGRNINPKIVLMDLSMKINGILKRKA